MIPSWSKSMVVRLTILAIACVLVGGAAWTLNQSFGGDAAPTAPYANVAKPDASGEPTGASSGKVLSLVDAVHLLEKTGRGEVVKIERIGTGAKTQYNVEIINKEGSRRVLHVDALGKAIADNTPPPTSKGGSKKTKGSERDRR